MARKIHKIRIVYDFLSKSPYYDAENIEKNMYPTMMPENFEKKHVFTM